MNEVVLKTFVPFLLLAALAWPVEAETMESAAKLMGKFFGRQYTAQLLCLGEGVSVPKISEMKQENINMMKQLQKDYPEYFGMGYAEGKLEALSMLSDKSYYPAVCAKLGQMLDRFR